MKNIKVGQVAEWTDGEKVEVATVDNNRQRFGLIWHGSTIRQAVAEGMDQPFSELVDMGNGRVIWNHE